MRRFQVSYCSLIIDLEIYSSRSFMSQIWMHSINFNYLKPYSLTLMKCVVMSQIIDKGNQYYG